MFNLNPYDMFNLAENEVEEVNERRDSVFLMYDSYRKMQFIEDFRNKSPFLFKEFMNVVVADDGFKQDGMDIKYDDVKRCVQGMLESDPSAITIPGKLFAYDGNISTPGLESLVWQMHSYEKSKEFTRTHVRQEFDLEDSDTDEKYAGDGGAASDRVRRQWESELDALTLDEIDNPDFNPDVGEPESESETVLEDDFDLDPDKIDNPDLGTSSLEIENTFEKASPFCVVSGISGRCFKDFESDFRYMSNPTLHFSYPVAQGSVEFDIDSAAVWPEDGYDDRYELYFDENDEIEVTLYSVRDSKGRDVAANRSLIKGSDMPDFFSYLRSGYRDMASRIDAFGVEKAKESEIDGGLDR